MRDTRRLKMFNPVTPCMSNRLNNQPPITAPTIPRAMSRKNPSPLLLTSLLPIKPAIRPSTIPAMIDMICPPGLVQAVSVLDHLVRSLEKRLRNRQPERFGRLEVDNQLELRRPFDWSVARSPPSFRQPVYVACRLLALCAEVDAVREKGAPHHPLFTVERDGQPLLRREPDDERREAFAGDCAAAVSSVAKRPTTRPAISRARVIFMAGMGTSVEHSW